MKKQKLNELLNTACEIITELEKYADDDQKKKIDSLFDEINGKDPNESIIADLESQSWDVFGKKKI